MFSLFDVFSPRQKSTPFMLIYYAAAVLCSFLGLLCLSQYFAPIRVWPHTWAWNTAKTCETEVKAFETNSKYLKGHFQRFDCIHWSPFAFPWKKTGYRTKNTKKKIEEKNDFSAKNFDNRVNIGFPEISGSPVVCCENHILPEFVNGKWNYGGSRIRAAEEHSLSQCCWLLS